MDCSTHGAPRSKASRTSTCLSSPQFWLASCPGLWFCRRGPVTNSEPGPTPLWGTGRGFATYPQQEATRHLAVTPPCISFPHISDSPAFCCQALPPRPRPQQKRVLPNPGSLRPQTASSFCDDPTALYLGRELWQLHLLTLQKYCFSYSEWADTPLVYSSIKTPIFDLSYNQ